jgi:hypothetical protein
LLKSQKCAFPNDKAVLKILFLGQWLKKKWIKPISGWAVISEKLDIVLTNWDTADAA